MILFDSSDNRCYVTDTPCHSDKQDHINVVGFQKISPRESYPKEGFPDNCLFQEHGGRYISNYQIVYIANGEGDFQDRGINYKIKAGQFMLIQPGFWHSYSPYWETGWEEYYIGFSGPTLSKIAEEIFKVHNINLLKVTNADFAVPLFEEALSQGALDFENNKLLIEAILTRILTHIRFELQDNASSKATLLFKARQFMEDNLAKKINIDDISAHLGVSNSWFRKEFLKEAGIPPATFLLRVRLQTSKYLLLSSNDSIKEISTKCGFTTSDYFCKFFRDNTGMTPSEFRESRSPGKPDLNILPTQKQESI